MCGSRWRCNCAIAIAVAAVACLPACVFRSPLTTRHVEVSTLTGRSSPRVSRATEGHILFVRGGNELWITDPDGVNQKRIYQADGDIKRLTYALNSQTVAFEVDVNGSPEEIVIMDVRSGRRIPFKTRADVSFAQDIYPPIGIGMEVLALSSDGQKIAYTPASHDANLAVMNADGTHVGKPAMVSGNLAGFSSDGSQVLLWSTDKGCTTVDVGLSNDMTNEQRIDVPGDTQIVAGRYGGSIEMLPASSHGFTSYLPSIADENTLGFDSWRLDAGNVTSIASFTGIVFASSSPPSAYMLGWPSPDGMALTYPSTKNGSMNIYKMDSQGVETRLTNELREDSSPVWVSW
jgi:hypothetical protein